MGRVSDLEKKWRGGSTDADNWDDVSHTATLHDFFSEFLVLHKLTLDKRFMEMRHILGDLIVEHGLTDGRGRWKKGVHAMEEVPADDYAAAVAHFIKKGMSKREAFANVAVRFSVRAASFEAAVQQVRRAWEKGQDKEPAPKLD